MKYTPQIITVLAIVALSACVSNISNVGNSQRMASERTAEARFDRFTYEGRSQEVVQPGPAEYRNPILSGYYPDPSITRVGDDYFLVNSSFTNFPGIPVFHSKDLVNWEQIGNAISRPSQFNFKGLSSSRGIYAPDISYHDDLFYIVSTCVGCAGNFVMTASNPAGPWSDPKPLKFGGIDPSIFWDKEGKAYIVNNGDPIETPRYDGHRAIWVQEFDANNLTLIGERTLIINGGVDLAKKPIWIEGPHMFKRGNFYYLIAAEGGTGDQHSEVVFRSTSVRGPFKPFENNPILSQRNLATNRPNAVTSAGHAKFVETQNGEWWATFLATRPYDQGYYNIGRETFLLPVTWKEGWPSLLENGKPIPFAAPKPNLPAQSRPVHPFSGDFAYVDEFTGTHLSDEWIGIRTPTTPFYTLEKGTLVLTAGGQLGDLQTPPAFIGRRQQHHIATVSTNLSYRPTQDGDRAGLVAYQSDESYLFYGLTKISGRTVVALYTRAKATQDVLVASAPVTDQFIALTIHTNGGNMTFDYTVKGHTSQLASNIDATFLSTRKATGFTGTIIGLYVCKSREETMLFRPTDMP